MQSLHQLPKSDTQEQFNFVIAHCKALFLKKAQDYGTSWRIMRMPSITDQIFIKARRIRSIEETGLNLVNEGIEGELIAIVNYAVMALIQSKLGVAVHEERLSAAQVESYYDAEIEENKRLLFAKNHDYGEAWRNMRTSSITDIILMKLLRTKEIENNEGKTLVSEGVDANYRDMINYAVFALILRNTTT